MITIMGEKYQCIRCGRYFYTNVGGAVLMGVRCPFFCSGGIGKFIQGVKIIL